MVFKCRGQKSKVQTSTNQPDQPVGGRGVPIQFIFVNVTAQNSHEIKFYIFLGGQQNFVLFQKKYFWDTL